MSFCYKMFHCIFTFRLVCETLLSSEKLKYSDPDIWCHTLQLIRQLVGGAGYKVIHSAPVSDVMGLVQYANKLNKDLS